MATCRNLLKRLSVLAVVLMGAALAVAFAAPGLAFAGEGSARSLEELKDVKLYVNDEVYSDFDPTQDQDTVIYDCDLFSFGYDPIPEGWTMDDEWWGTRVHPDGEDEPSVDWSFACVISDWDISAEDQIASTRFRVLVNGKTPRNYYDEDYDCYIPTDAEITVETHGDVSNVNFDRESTGWYDVTGRKCSESGKEPYEYLFYVRYSDLDYDTCEFSAYAAGFQKSLTRVAGDSRWASAAAVGDTLPWGNHDCAVIASGDDFPDALAASSLAGVAGAPVILTQKNTFPAEAEAQLRKLDPDVVMVIGGESAISSKVYNRIQNIVGDNYVERLYGSSRYETSLAILDQKVVVGENDSPLWSDTVIVASGLSYADALSISSYAYSQHAPIILADPKTGLSAKALGRIKSHGFTKAIVVGGTSVVNPAVEGQLKNSAGVATVKRLAGPTRFETSVAIAEFELAEGFGDEYFNMDGVVFATANDFADALAASALAGQNAAPLVLVGNNQSIYDFCSKYGSKCSYGYVIGGEKAIPESLKSTLESKLFG